MPEYKDYNKYHLFGYELGNPPDGFAEHYWGGGYTPEQALEIVHERQLHSAELVCLFGMELDNAASYMPDKDEWYWHVTGYINEP